MKTARVLKCLTCLPLAFSISAALAQDQADENATEGHNYLGLINLKPPVYRNT